MVELFRTVAYLYKKPTSDWIYEMEEYPAPIIVNKFLSMNIKNARICKVLNKYIFTLEPKAWLLLAWSMIPKSDRAPFVKYLKSEKDEPDELQFLWDKVKKVNECKCNDFKHTKEMIFNAYEKDREGWFKFYGIEKRKWKKFGLDFKVMKEGEREIKTIPKGLEGWF